MPRTSSSLAEAGVPYDLIFQFEDINDINGYGENCDMVYGDAQAVLIKMIEAVRGLGTAAAA